MVLSTLPEGYLAFENDLGLAALLRTEPALQGKVEAVAIERPIYSHRRTESVHSELLLEVLASTPS
jgi:hypothetical protein